MSSPKCQGNGGNNYGCISVEESTFIQTSLHQPTVVMVSWSTSLDPTNKPSQDEHLHVWCILRYDKQIIFHME